jgi:hypothetical protein
MAKEKKEETANIAFVGKKPWKPLTEVNNASGSFAIAADQSKPFYHEQATYLIQTYPHLYKPMTGKDGK